MSARKVWQCYYCGGMMDDHRAARVIKDLPYLQKIHACPACEALVPVSRLKTLAGRQSYISNVLGNGYGFVHQERRGLIRYVDRYGRTFWKNEETGEVEKK